jgi:hypothetical protein
MGAGIGDIVGQRLGREVRVHHQDAGIVRGERDVGEVAHRIVVEVAIERRRDRERGDVGNQQRVAVGRHLGDLRRAYARALAGSVVDHDVLAESLAEIFGDDSADHVGRAAG